MATNEEREIVGVIGSLNRLGKPRSVICWAKHKSRKDKGEASYSFPPLGPYAQYLHDETFKKWKGAR